MSRVVLQNLTPAAVPVRMCVVCRGRFAKRELVRHVCPPQPGAGAHLVPDPRQSLPGRGFYHCAREACARKFPAYGGWRKKCKGVLHEQTQGA